MVIFLNVGDFVGRKSYNCDIVFVISAIVDSTAVLQGYYVRLVADSPLSDLVLIEREELERFKNSDEEYKKSIIDGYKNKTSHITGKILHIDSDPNYLKRCLSLYESLNLYAYGVTLKESEIEKYILDYINKVRPNIIILTGHDSYNKKGLHDLNNYKTTKDYIRAVIKIRERYSLDDICVFAGACGSNFEALIASGANFASSIDRNNIEAYDPAIVAVISAITPLNQIIEIKSVNNYSKIKSKSIGGVETYGKMRLLIR
jgi:spore coat assembly protein